MKHFLAHFILCLNVLPAMLHAAAPLKPNVIVVIVDDSGYGDIGAHGNKLVKTPHLDRLHKESARLTDFHVDPTCSPTRAALMTGKYAHRVKVWHTIAGGNHLEASQKTMADIFRFNGYRTGMFGKWHLGANLPYRPIDRGFDEWIGQGDGGAGTTDDFFFNDRVNDHYLHNGEWKQIDGWSEEVFFRKAQEFIRSSKKNNQPFFAYLATYSPHSPITLPAPEIVKKYQSSVDANTAYFLAAIEKIDTYIGDLRATLEAENLARDTIVIYLTDNGGTYGTKVFNAGMRGKKGDVYDGGHRVPCFIHWPGGEICHGQDISSLHAHIDLLPTLIDLCALKTPNPIDFDGESFLPSLKNPATPPRERTLIVERQRTHIAQKNTGCAVMHGPWRLVDNTQLHNLKNDPAQQTNLFSAQPEIVTKLRTEYETYWQSVSPEDRQRPITIIGEPRDAEVHLHSSDWYLPQAPWNHMLVARGTAACGDWNIRAHADGNYQFEVRRWPREAKATLAGIPNFQKTIDAWDASGPKPDLLYGSKNTRFKALPVAFVRLTIGDNIQITPALETAEHITFTTALKADTTYQVTAELLDTKKKRLSGAYYVYGKKSPPSPAK
jgi:arylsulfatase A-like enzyme